jgi:shikimate kinase
VNPECNKLIKEKTFCIYLTCTIKELAFRLKDTASQRPVFAAKGTETDTEDMGKKNACRNSRAIIPTMLKNPG